MTDAWFDEDSATFGDRLAAARERAGMTQGQMAQRLGVKRETLQGWEEDRAEPRANRLQMAAGMLNVSMVWLLTGQGDGVAAPAAASDDAEAAPGAAPDAAIAALLGELREAQIAQARAAERLGRVERRLRALAAAR